MDNKVRVTVKRYLYIFTPNFEDSQACLLNCSKMSSETFSDMEVNPLLSEDAFKSEESRKLFEAIDELRSCGANYDLKIIPEVSQCS